MDLLRESHSIESKIQQNYPEYDDFLLYMNTAEKHTVDNSHFAEQN